MTNLCTVKCLWIEARWRLSPHCADLHVSCLDRLPSHWLCMKHPLWLLLVVWAWKGLGLGRGGSYRDSSGQRATNQGKPSPLRRCHPCRPIWPCRVSALGTWQRMSNRVAKTQSHGQACRPAIGVRSTFERRFGGQFQKLFAQCLSALPQKPHRTGSEAFLAPNEHGGGLHMHPTPKRPQKRFCSLAWCPAACTSGH